MTLRITIGSLIVIEGGGVLIEAKRRGAIDAIRPILDRLLTEAGFRLAPLLLAAVLREATED